MLVLANFTAEDIVKLFEEDVRARRRLAELLVMEPDVRLAIINAVIRDVATKEYLNRLRIEIRDEIERLRSELRSEFRSEIGEIRREINELREEVASLRGQVNMLTKMFIAFNLPVLLAVIGLLLKMIFTY